MLRPPCGVERFSPRAVKKADESQCADNEQRPLQYFGARGVRLQMAEQREVGESPKRNEARPVKQNRSERNSGARPPCRPTGVTQSVQLVAHPGALRWRIRRADRGIGCQWKSVRHDPVRQTR